MFRVYIDEVIQSLDDIVNINDSFETSIIREDGIANTEQILRDKSEMDLFFCGSTYSYICNKFKSNTCDDITYRIVDDRCGLEQKGVIKLSSIELYPDKKYGKTKIKDNSFSAYIRDFFDVELYLYLSQTKNCLPIATIEKLVTMYTNPANQIDTSQINAFDFLDAIQYLVSFFTDNTIEVESDYLTTNKFSFTTGFNMHNYGTKIDSIYPKVSLSQIFTELRKKVHVYMSIEYRFDGTPYLRIEDEAYFYENTQLFEIDSVPNGTVQNKDVSRLFADIKVGSDKTETDGTIYYPQDSFTAWNEENFPFCGTCNAEKDNVLDLVSSFIIDSNLIYEALNFGLADYTNDDSIFMFEYYDNSGVDTAVTTLDALSSTYVYNININNENVINNWIDYIGKCIILSRNNKYGFLLRDFFVEIGITGPSLPGISANENRINYSDIIYDNENSIDTQSPFGDICKVFTAQQNGTYNFKLIVNNIHQVGIDCGGGFILGGGVACFDVTYKAIIYIYSDNTFATLLYTFEDVGLASNAVTDFISLSIETGVISLGVGNVVITSLYGEMPVPNSNTGCTTFFDSDFASFYLLSDGFSCSSLEYNNQNAKENVLKFDYPLCYEDYAKARLNKKGYITIENTNWWIKELTYKHRRNSSFILVGNDALC